MACPDRANDKRIIAEVERRKALKEKTAKDEAKRQTEWFDGDLVEYLMIHPYVEHIQKIVKIGEQQYEIEVLLPDDKKTM